ncbi:MAG: HEAT repeat domain-containing protein [Leptospira sp.]|nr:HEAT repeat domain-containing protein [Leptospira sp.]
MEAGYHNFRKGQDIILLTGLSLILSLFVNCTTSKPYQLTDVAPKLRAYQGTDLDPYKNNPILITETKNRKYDELIKEAHMALSTLEFAEAVAIRADSKKTVGEPVQKEMEAAAAVEDDLPKIVASLPETQVKLTELIKDVPNDFDGPMIGRVTRELGELSSSLNSISSRAPAIQSSLRNLRADANNYADSQLINKNDETLSDSEKNKKDESTVLDSDPNINGDNDKKIDTVQPAKKEKKTEISIKRVNRKTKVTGKANEMIDSEIRKQEDNLSDEEKKDLEYTEQIKKGLVQVFQQEYFRNHRSLEKILTTHPIPRVRAAAALALGRIRAGRVALQSAIDKDGYQVRPSAYKALSEIGDKRSLSYFIAGTKAEDPEVIAVSYEGLGKTKDPAGREMILSTGLNSEYVIIVCSSLRGLAYNHVPADIEIYERFLKSEEPEIKEAVIESLAIHGTRDSLRVLERVVKEEPTLSLLAIEKIEKNPSLSATLALIRINENSQDERVAKRIGEALLRRKAFGRYAIILIEDDFLRQEPNERSKPVSYIKAKEIGFVLGETKKEFAVRIGEDILTDKYIQLKMESTLPGARESFVSGWVFYPKLDIIEVKKLGSDGKEGKYSNIKKGKHSNLFNPEADTKSNPRD